LGAAIGMRVDDAIVVGGKRRTQPGAGFGSRGKRRSGRWAEVSGPIIAIALVLCAVFDADSVHRRTFGTILQTVRVDDCDFDR